MQNLNQLRRCLLAIGFLIVTIREMLDKVDDEVLELKERIDEYEGDVPVQLNRACTCMSVGVTESEDATDPERDSDNR